ncbi:MAG: histidine kinase [Marinilabiliaceae bacterium]|nr:histidine kinase [Marinilabiliaceae bacterium]
MAFVFILTKNISAQPCYYIHHTIDNGLPSNEINDYAIDKNGVYWFGTKAGLVRWGNSFEVFTIKNGLPSNHISAIKFDNNGNLFIGTSGKGIALFEGEKFTHLNKKEGLQNDKIKSLNYSPKHQLIFIESLFNISILKNKTIIQTTQCNCHLLKMISETDSSIIFTSENNNLITYNIRSKIFNYKLISNQNNTQYNYKPELEMANYNIKDLPVPANEINFIDYNQHDHTLIIGTKKTGLYILPQNIFQCISYPDSLSTTLSIEKNEQTINIYGNKHFSINTLNNNIIVSAAKETGFINPVNQLTFNDNIVYYTNNKSFYSQNIHTRNIKTKLIFPDSCLYFASYNDEISCCFTNTFSVFNKGDMQQIIKINTPTGIRKCITGKQYIILISHEYGVYVLNKTTKKLHILSDFIKSLPENIIDAGFDNYERPILFDSDGGIHIITIYENHAILNATINPPNTLTEETLKWFLCDSDDNIWIGTQTSLHHFNSGSDLSEPILQCWGKTEGYNFPNAYKAIELNKKIFIFTPQKIAHFQPKDLFLIQRIPSIKLSQISFKGDAINWKYEDREMLIKGIQSDESNKIDINYSKNSIAFNFESTNTIGKNQIMYRHKLIPDKTSWSRFSKNNSVYIPKLRPGNYTLKIQAYFEKTPSNVQTIEYNFTIKLPWYRHIIAYVIYSSLFITITVYIFFNNIKKNQKKEEANLLIRERMALLKMEALQMQMNPHFIFNALNSLQYLILENNTEESLEFVGEFSQLIRSTLDNASKQLISLKEEISYIENYLRVEKLRYSKHIEYSISYTDDIDLARLKIPPMLIQPHVENAIKYSITENISYIIISIAKLNDCITCMIEDNGIGRSQSSLLKKKHQSRGQNITKERLNLLNFYYKKHNDYRFEIEDLFDETQNPTGTRVTVFFPVIIYDNL